MSVTSALRSLETVSQTIANFLTVPITSTDVSNIVIGIELVKGIVREFPIMEALKSDILNRLDQAETLVQRTPPDLTDALTVLQLVALKIENLPIC